MVTSFVDLIRQRHQDRLDGQAREYFSFVMEGALRMQGLIGGLLAYSRVGTQGRKFVASDCRAILQNAWIIYGPTSRDLAP